jgi:SAM-dependent methyltransferase
MARRPAKPNAARAVDVARFDAAYYERFYGERSTRVSDSAAVARLSGFVAGYLRYLQLPVRSVLDIGCGVGHWRAAVATTWPRAAYHGVEASEHLCQRYGWRAGSIVDFDPHAAWGQRHFDLVVCQGVLQYLDDKAAAQALANLAQWTRGALYLEALTRADWQHNCDRTRTDGNVHLRSGTFYRRHLRRSFLTVGGGLFVARTTGVTLFELEGE